MKTSQLVTTAALVLAGRFAAAKPVSDDAGTKLKRADSPIVYDTPMGFASGTTGGGNTAPVYPSNIDELKTYLTSSEPQNIYISGMFDFTGSEGTISYEACDTYSCSTSNGGQALLNTLDGCGSRPTYSVSIDAAAYSSINVQSNKSLVGRNGATIKSKGLRFAGSSNIIVQNIAITDLNPKYVWGGDALIFSDSNNIWIDHVTTARTGRQHYSFGRDPSQGITISNSFLDGRTSNSATCDGRTYWALELVGSNDRITFYKNHVLNTSGRTPALSGGTFFHAVNNVWSSNSGHLIEGDSNGMGVYEGNYFDDVPVVVAPGFVGRLFTSDPSNVSQCASYLGRNCVSNSLSNSGAFSFDDTGILSVLQGSNNIVSAASASSIQNTVPSSAGNTL